MLTRLEHIWYILLEQQFSPKQGQSQGARKSAPSRRTLYENETKRSTTGMAGFSANYFVQVSADILVSIWNNKLIRQRYGTTQDNVE